MLRNIKALTVLTLVLVCTTGVANAQNDTDEWQFQIAPLYLWATDVGGTMTIRGQGENEFHMDFDDLFSNLEMAFTVHFEARKGRWGLLADVMYLDLAGTQDINTPGETADVEIKNMILEGAAGYEFSDSWWAVAGVRYLELDPKVTTQAGPSLDPSESLTDLFAGVMWRPKLGKRWQFSGRFDIGAGSSDLVWNAAAIFDYSFGSWAAVLFGYRILDYDYENQNSGVATDMTMSGPVAAFRFFW